MLLRHVLAPMALAVASLAVLTSATAAPTGQASNPTSHGLSVVATSDNIISSAEYAAIKKGMTRPQLGRATHGATYTRDHVGRCALRFYKGWDRQEHANVGVLMGPAHRVFAKAVWSRDGGFGFICSAAPPAIPRSSLLRGLGTGVSLN